MTKEEGIAGILALFKKISRLSEDELYLFAEELYKNVVEKATEEERQHWIALIYNS